MALSAVNRLRIALRLVKDGNVTTDANYASNLVDYLDAATGTKYVEAVIHVHGGIDVDTIAAMTNEQKATAYLNTLRRWHSIALRQYRQPAALQASDATAQGEVDTDLGTEE